jgi:hypothetical protein
VDIYALDHRGHGATARPASQLGDLWQSRPHADPSQLAKIRKRLPIYVFSGDHDPLNPAKLYKQKLKDEYATACVRERGRVPRQNINTGFTTLPCSASCMASLIFSKGYLTIRRSNGNLPCW